MAGTRLRKTFQYPSEGDDADEPAVGLDEQEQEVLIDQLREQDLANTAFYRKAFFVVLAVVGVSYLPAALSTAHLADRVAALCSVLSLACSAYVLYSEPLSRHLASRGDMASTSAGGHPMDVMRSSIGSQSAPQSMIQRLLPSLNAGLCLVLAFHGLRTETGPRHNSWAGLLPGTIFLFVLLARTQLKPLDVGQLERLKYGYKGA